MVEVSKRQASAFISGLSVVGGSVIAWGDITIHWDDIAEYAVIEVILAWAFGLTEVILTVGRVQAALITGFAEFLTAGVRIWALGPAQAVKASWSGLAYQMFGPAAPFVVLAELLIVAGAATYLVRRL